MNKIPCIDCLVLPVCKSLYLKRYHTEIESDFPTLVSHTDGKLALTRKCSLFETYIDKEIFNKQKDIEFCKIYNPDYYDLKDPT